MDFCSIILIFYLIGVLVAFIMLMFIQKHIGDVKDLSKIEQDDIVYVYAILCPLSWVTVYYSLSYILDKRK